MRELGARALAMPKRSRKRNVIIAVVAGALALALSGYVLRDFLREQFWLRRFESEDPEQQRVAGEKLADMRSAQAIRRLVELCALKGTYFEDRYYSELDSGEAELEWSCECVVRIGPRATAELLYILRASEDSDELDLEDIAVWALGEIGAIPALPALLEISSSSADRAVVKLGRRAVPLLADRVADGSQVPGARQHATELLGRIGLDASEAVPIVARLLSLGKLRLTAIDALARMGPSSVQFLAPLLEDGSFEVVHRAVAALGDIGVASADVLVDALEHEELRIREAAAAALRRLGDDPRVVSSLVRALESTTTTVRFYSVRLLKHFAHDEASVGPLVEETMLNDPSPLVRAAAIEALAELQRSARSKEKAKSQ